MAARADKGATYYPSGRRANNKRTCLLDQVERIGPEMFGGFNWTITFTSDNQDGDLPLITIEDDDLTGTEVRVEVFSVEDGSYLSGYLNVSFAGTSTMVMYNATAEDMRVTLEGIGTGNVAVFREGDVLI